LRGSVRDIFFAWLREHRPDLLERYEALYAHGAYLRPVDRRKVERDAGAPWAGSSYDDRLRHRGLRRGRPERPRAAPTTAPAVQKRPPVQASLF
jgi:hypothetical protein